MSGAATALATVAGSRSAAPWGTTGRRVAGLVTFPAGPTGRQITGTTLTVDGGANA